jgi:hypothetical protein
LNLLQGAFDITVRTTDVFLDIGLDRTSYQQIKVSENTVGAR